MSPREHDAVREPTRSVDAVDRAGRPRQRLRRQSIALQARHDHHRDPAVYHQLGGTGTAPEEYGDLAILTVPDQGPVKMERRRFGP